MQNIHRIKSIAVVLSLLPYLCSAEEDHYVSVQSGVSTINKKVGFNFSDLKSGPYSKHRLKNSITFDIALGKRVYNNLFGELEYAYTHGNKFKIGDNVVPLGNEAIVFTGKVRSHNFFGNLNYQIKEFKTWFTPYVTLGAGLSLNQVNKLKYTLPATNQYENTKNVNHTSFAWQAGMGVLIPIRKKLELNISYKYRDLGKVRSGVTEGVTQNVRTLNSRINSSNFLVGVSYKF